MAIQPDGWVVDSEGAIYNVGYGSNTKKAMNVRKLLHQLLFVDSQPVVFFYRREQLVEYDENIRDTRMTRPSTAFLTRDGIETIFEDPLTPFDDVVSGYHAEHGDHHIIRTTTRMTLAEPLTSDSVVDVWPRGSVRQRTLRDAQRIFLDKVLLSQTDAFFGMPAPQLAMLSSYKETMAMLRVMALSGNYVSSDYGPDDPGLPRVVYTRWEKRRRGF